MFNTAGLDAVSLQMGKDALKKEVAKKLAEWAPKMDESILEKFSNAMARFLVAGDVANTPEVIVELLERFRRYSPIFKAQDYLEFQKTRQAFSNRLMMLANARIGKPRPKETEINSYYMTKATEYRGKVAWAGMMIDRVELERLMGAWNKIAEEWSRKLDVVRAEAAAEKANG